jgi:hypothetical protein
MRGMGRRVGRSWVGNEMLCQTMDMTKVTFSEALVADYQHLLCMAWKSASSSGGSKTKVYLSEKGQECRKSVRLTSEVLAAIRSETTRNGFATANSSSLQTLSSVQHIIRSTLSCVTLRALQLLPARLA